MQASARAYSEATFESPLAHALVIPATGNCPKIIAFRGSADVRAWLTDFRITLSYTAYGRVHSGFWRSAGSVTPRLLQLTPEPVIITGHSKGAAEALICAIILAGAGWPIVRVVTFGGPRVGDAVWREGYNLTRSPKIANGQWPMADGKTLGETTERWVHEEDIVARLPVWISNYRHTLHEYFCSSFGGVEIDPPLSRLALSDLWGTFWGYRRGHVEQAEDHPISRYQEHLASL